MIAAFRSLVVAVLFQVFMVSGSKAEPIDNIDDWLKRFQYAAAKSDIQGMIDIINANRDPRMDTSRIKPAFDTIINPSGRQPVSYASLLRDQKLGDMVRRDLIGIMYQNSPVFIQVSFLRNETGWQVIFVNINTDLDQSLERGWLK